MRWASVITVSMMCNPILYLWMIHTEWCVHADSDCQHNGTFCDDDRLRYCPGLSCYGGMCQNCTVENATCTNETGVVPCCGNLTCFDGSCKPCSVDAECGKEINRTAVVILHASMIVASPAVLKMLNVETISRTAAQVCHAKMASVRTAF